VNIPSPPVNPTRRNKRSGQEKRIRRERLFEVDQEKARKSET
jgi:hypothetical protein